MRKEIVGCSIVVIFAILATSAVAADPETPENLLAVVNTGDGVTKGEAEKIAKVYFLQHVSCGSFMSISEAKNVWIVNGLLGVAAKTIKGFTIDKRSGAISSPIGPSYKRPEDLVRKS
jgi:hypothetical protein